MNMLGTIGRIGRKLALVALTLGALGLASCGITEPEENPWQDVSKFSWPLNTSTKMTYEAKKLTNGKVDTTLYQTVSTLDTAVNGTHWFTFKDQASKPWKSNFRWDRVQYRATSDTLLMENVDFGGALQLVGPLEKGRTWFSPATSIEPAKQVWKATIMQQYSVLQLDFKQYKNVVVVKYEKVELSKDEGPKIGYRYYAEGIGPIKSVDNSFDSNPAIYEPNTVFQRIMLSSTANQN